MSRIRMSLIVGAVVALASVTAGYTTAASRAPHTGGTLKLLNMTKRIKDLLSITKLLTVFDTFDSEAEAVTSFSAPV